jgi:uncharacterized protein (TIGR01777 family)
MRVFMTGATGVVGPRLIRRLIKRGDQVVVLSRKADAWEKVGQDVSVIVGDPNEPGDWQSKLAECDAVVNLAGAGIFERRWDDDYKKLLRESRLRSTSNVVAAMATPDCQAKTLVSASAIGYYGPRGDEVITEDSPPGDDFMARICIEWEQAAFAAETHGVRVSAIRIGIVHDNLGAALPKILLPFKLGLGGPIGMALNPKDWGKHYWSWIHYADLCGIMLTALDNAEAKGPINGTAPNPVTNKEFAKALGKVLGRPAFAPTPALALRLMLGEVAEVITTGQRVVPARAMKLGYVFEFPEIESALYDLLKKAPASAT